MRMRVLQLKWICFVVGICCSNVFALDMLGPSNAELSEGHWEFGADYSYSKLGLDFDFKSGSAAQSDFSVVEMKMQTISGRVGYGISDSFEVFTRLGSTTIKESENNRKLDLDGYNCGFGAKATILEYYLLKFGIQAQANWFDTNGDWTRLARTGDADIKLLQIFIAGSANYQLMDSLFMYGGPFVYLEDGEQKYKELSPTPGLSEKYDISNKTYIGGYIGFRVHLPAELKLNLEYQITSTDDVVALGLVWRH